MQTRRTFMLAASAGLLLATGVKAQQPPQLTAEDVFTDPITPVLGNPDGNVTIVEFFDYQCPFCKSSYPELRQFVEQDGNLRLLMRDWPIFGEPSRIAAERILSLGAAEYVRAHEALMATEGRLSESDIEDVLAHAGVATASPAHTPNAVAETLIRNDQMAQAFGLSGTPAYVIGTRVYGGVLDATALSQAVREAREA